MMKPKAVYTPLDWQLEPLRDKASIMLLTGAAGGGKSRLAAEKVHAYMLKYPGATGIMGRKDRTSANKSVVPFMRYTVQQDTGWGVYKQSAGLFEYTNGSNLWVVGMRDENQREALRSIGKDGSVDIAWMEEANKLTDDDNNEIAARMRGTAAPWRQRIYTTNPGPPDHWIKKRFIDGGGASVYYSRPEDNPYNPPDYIETLKNLTGVSRDRLWLGLWVQAEGAVYTEYDVSKHLIDWNDLPGLMKGELPPHGRYVVSIDFGYTNPLTATLWHIDNDGVVYLVKQVYHTKRTVEEHCPAIRKMTRGLKVEAWVTDHDAEDRATLERHLGITTIGAYKSVLPGISAVKSRLKDGRIKFVRGALVELDIALEKAKKPTCTIDEIGGYRWSDKKQDTPVKENDHGMDDTRYFIAYIDKISTATFKLRASASVDNYLGKKEEKEKDKLPAF